jgi:ATP-dependent DNA helicase RecQ
MAYAIETVLACEETHFMDHIIRVIRGEKSDGVSSYKHHLLPQFGLGKDKEALYWTSILRNAIIQNLLYREIEEYNTLKVSEKGKAYIEQPYVIKIAMNHDYENEIPVVFASGNTSALDKVLFQILKDVRKGESKKLNLPPYIVVQDPALEEMCLKYPVTLQEFGEIAGITKAKVAKFGQVFVDAISKYVKDHNIERPVDMTIRTVVNKNSDKIKIIKSIDKKISLESLAAEMNIEFSELVDELESIVISGTKIDINYFLDEIMDGELLEEMYEFFQNNETGDIEACYQAFIDDDLPEDDIRLVKLQFISNNLN